MVDNNGNDVVNVWQIFFFARTKQRTLFTISVCSSLAFYSFFSFPFLSLYVHFSYTIEINVCTLYNVLNCSILQTIGTE